MIFDGYTGLSVVPISKYLTSLRLEIQQKNIMDNPIQRRLHLPSELGKSVDPTFSWDYYNVAYSDSQTVDIEPVVTQNPDGTVTITFTFDQSFSVVQSTTLYMTTPEYATKSADIMIALPDNFFHNYVSRAELKFGDQSMTTMDTSVFDALIQTAPVRTSRKQYLRNIGNNGVLNVFNHRLAASRVSFPVPWGWSRRNSPPLPLFLIEGPVTVSYTLKPVTSLLRVVQRNRQGQEILRKYNPNDPVDVPPLPIPRMVCEYANLTPEEIEIQKSITRQMSLDSFASIRVPVVDGMGRIRINNDWPMRSVFVMAQNMKAALVNNLSNYSTDYEDSYKGNGPLLLLQGLEAGYYSDDAPLWSGIKAPERPGYYLIPLSDLEKYIVSGPTDLEVSATVTTGEYELCVIAYAYQLYDF
jgi:hypothetical protein